MTSTAKHNQLLQLSKMKLEDILSTLEDGEFEDIELCYNRINGLITKLEVSMDETAQNMLENEQTLDEIKVWSTAQKEDLKLFREARTRAKKSLSEGLKREEEENLQRKVVNQQKINEENTKARMLEMKDREEATLRQQQLEEEWLRKKLDIEKEAKENMVSPSASSISQAVKLQRYTITPFFGDYKDWIRFWNQFEVEVDGAKISEISKFNYLLELVKDKPKEDILGLPHTVQGYEEAKRILKSTYGKDFKVHKALIKELESLHSIINIHQLNSVHEFYNKLARIVRTLATMKKLETAQSAVYTLMDKLGPIREILAQTDDNWEKWTLEDLVQSLQKYVERNPLGSSEEDNKRDDPLERKRLKEKLLMERNRRYKSSRCVYCGTTNHATVSCTTVLTVANRKDILRTKKLCYNCTGDNHLVSSCRSRPCRRCGQKHHTSICEKDRSTLSESGDQASKPEKNMSASSRTNSTLHATVRAKVNGQDARIMIDTGAGSSYICSDLVTKLQSSPVHRETRCIEQMYGTVTKRVELHSVNIQSTAIEGFNLDVQCINAEKNILTFLPNPRIKELKRRYPRLWKLPLSDEETTTDNIPVHIILGAADYQRIRSTEQPILGKNPDVDPGAEFTMLGWILYGRLMSDSHSVEKEFFLNSSQSEFERLCSLDVLGLVDSPSPDNSFHEDFTEHLQITPDGYYETRLPWKADHGVIPSNKELAMARLRGTTKRLEKQGKLLQYDAIMKEQLQKGILEPIPQQPTGEVTHYIPHHPVIREEAESTKIRIVYDCSAKSKPDEPSLNDCLETGPALQPLLFDILMRNRMEKLCVMGDIEKAFHQIRVREEDRDAQRVLWYNNLQEKKVLEYRFTRVIFGAGPSPYILGATLHKHLSKYQERYPDTTRSLLENTYVDDIQDGGDDEQALERFKTEATEIMQDGGFVLHKWHSNILALESTSERAIPHQEAQSNDAKILGTPWNKLTDELSVDFKPCYTVTVPMTKRKMLAAINGVYDILGLVSPIMITGKIIFSEVCLRKISWDELLPDDIVQQWDKWIKGLTQKPTVTIPRSVVDYNKKEISLHGFSDASKRGVCAAVYVVSKYSDGSVTQNLLVSKSRIAPRDTSIPRLELIAALTLAKLLNHTRNTLHSYTIAETHMWVDSITVLYWLQHKGKWSRYVNNRVQKIHDLTTGSWHYVPTAENPSDLGTRGITPARMDEFWLKGPNWLRRVEDWPAQPVVEETKAVQTEINPHKDRVLLENEQMDNTQEGWTNEILQKYKYWKLLRITALVQRFINHCRKENKSGPLNTEEMELAEQTWIAIAQKGCELQNNIPIKKDNSGIWRWHGRVPGYHPIFLPRQHKLTELVVEHYHQKNLHGGVQFTMNKVREKFWIPRLRRMANKQRFNCNHCKKLRARPLPAPPMSALPSYRAELADAFAATGVDFAGPLYHKLPNTDPGKAYIALFTCASTRAVHLRLCTDMTVTEFKRAMKEFVARRGAPQMMVSDNAKTFIATKTWLENLQQDEDLNNYLASQAIKWKFNLSRAPWWGGFFERLVGIMKSCLSKVIGKALLTFAELEETLLDIECFMNNRPLCYMGEEFDQQTITPNILIRGKPSTLLEENFETLDDTSEVTRRLRYLKKCRQQLRKRWTAEYLYALEERSRAQKTTATRMPSEGSVVLVKDYIKNHGKWKLGRVIRQIYGKDNVLRGFKIQMGSGYVVERPIQLVADLEIGDTPQPSKTILNPNAAEFQQRRQPERTAKNTAQNRILGIAMNELEEN